MKTIFWVLIGIVLVSAIVGAFAWGYVSSIEKPVKSGNYTASPPIKINYSNIETQLSKSSLVKAIPSGEIASLKFYNFNSGERTFEKSFVLKKGSLVEGNEKADVELWIHSKYLNELTNQNFCAILKKANQNGDLSIETNLSTVALGWKFKSMYEFKDCF